MKKHFAWSTIWKRFVSIQMFWCQGQLINSGKIVFWSELGAVHNHSYKIMLTTVRMMLLLLHRYKDASVINAIISGENSFYIIKLIHLLVSSHFTKLFNNNSSKNTITLRSYDTDIYVYFINTKSDKNHCLTVVLIWKGTWSNYSTFSSTLTICSSYNGPVKNNLLSV